MHVAVSEGRVDRVCVLSYPHGSLVCRFDRGVPRLLRTPRGVKLLADASGIVVADQQRDRVVLLSLALLAFLFPPVFPPVTALSSGALHDALTAGDWVGPCTRCCCHRRV